MPLYDGSLFERAMGVAINAATAVKAVQVQHIKVDPGLKETHLVVNQLKAAYIPFQSPLVSDMSTCASTRRWRSALAAWQGLTLSG